MDLVPFSSRFWAHSHYTLPQGPKADESRTVKFLTNTNEEPRTYAGRLLIQDREWRQKKGAKKKEAEETH